MTKRTPLTPVLAKIENDTLIIEIHGDYESYPAQRLRAVRAALVRQGYELFLV